MGDNQRVPMSLDDETATSDDSAGGVGQPDLPAAAALTAPPPLPALTPPPLRAALTAAPVRPALTASRTAPAASATPDAVCANAVVMAREAAIDVAGEGHVGEHLELDAEGERLVTHYFRCLSKGYRGWRWAVTVARASRARTATVCEVVLLPGQESVLAPAWLPWSDRIAPGDLGAADQLAYRADDPYLEPGYLATGDEDADRMAIWEFGLGRPRVLSPVGRAELAQRWYGSDRGPTSDEAVHAAAACSTCGYFLPLAGSLRQAFGVCGNEWSPSDARVVSVDHGCGAHSETDLERVAAEALPPPILDETGFEAVVLPPKETPEAETVAPEPVEPEAVVPEPVEPESVEQEPVSAE
jgi:hypothetical protein